MQEGWMIAYSSRKMIHHQEHRSTHDLQLEVIILALRTWWHYLLGNAVHIYMNHKSLKYIFMHPGLNMRLFRWLEMIKNYELEVHYHPGKADVIADALSHKAHCNYLLATCLTGEECSTRVLPNFSLHNITLTPLFREEIIATQKNDEGMAHLRRRLLEGDLKVNCFCEDAKKPYCSRFRLLCRRKKPSRRRF
jgi:hypothetical protein